MAALARKLRTVDYFTLAFGTMVGTGWLVVMDDWLRRGGPMGAMLGFALGGLILLPVGYVYGRLVIALPDAGSEIAYTARVFAPGVSFGAGWIMILAYLPVCPFEAVAFGKIAAYIFPALDSIELYRVAGRPVYLPHLAIGLAITVAIAALNYRGIRATATFQNWMTAGLLLLTALFVACGFARGSSANFTPLFSHPSWLAVLLVLQVVPFYLTGFESVGKCAEEANPEFRARGFFRAILLALVVGVAFYAAVIGAVAHVHSWPALTRESFATAFAFEQAFRARWIVNVILAAALLSLIKIFNGNFVASTRLLFALGRRGLVDPRWSRIHPANLTPARAVVGLGVVSAAAVFLGDSILVPISEVGSMASAVGWFAACAAYWAMKPGRRERALAATGAVVSAVLILMKVLPVIPGHFDRYEFLTLGLWCALGLILRRRTAAQRSS